MEHNALTAFYYLRAKRQKREDRCAYAVIIFMLLFLAAQVLRGQI